MGMIILSCMSRSCALSRSSINIFNHPNKSNLDHETAGGREGYVPHSANVFHPS